MKISYSRIEVARTQIQIFVTHIIDDKQFVCFYQHTRLSLKEIVEISFSSISFNP